eukprot:TRINITY_DN82_c1_g1_i1.p1 TRINITY_DN82_c1_g1~~TRINITY_DN82_c1_g1_i1.p1  ORF type:complete len:125 (-),score=46.80 TRINITY_DN82_c1_g1_i1:199-573(-)
MSWETYIYRLTTAGFAKAALFGHDGSIWAISNEFNIPNIEIAALIAAFENLGATRATGVFISKIRYFVILANERSIYGKQGNTGFCAVKTNKAVVLGLYTETLTPGNAANSIESISDFLINQGF